MAKQKELTIERVYVCYGADGSRTERREEDISHEELAEIHKKLTDTLYNAMGYEKVTRTKPKCTSA
jgi:hypothetical protein